MTPSLRRGRRKSADVEDRRLSAASRRQHGRDALVVEGCAAFVQEASCRQLGRYGSQAHLPALGLLAPKLTCH